MMNVEKETGSGEFERQLQQTKTDLDIYKLLNQMGIHPDKWLEFQAKKEEM
ncbi:hypothetical protein [Paenibacillus faecalis]|uniref:hypothetical protein n=1 Tax=Paenibacillus faecalis TaxID=2079532 RepID=UPI00131A4A2E|nr:hypothetical protein [Paenibacillus faecalis]